MIFPNVVNCENCMEKLRDVVQPVSASAASGPALDRATDTVSPDTEQVPPLALAVQILGELAALAEIAAQLMDEAAEALADCKNDLDNELLDPEFRSGLIGDLLLEARNIRMRIRK